MSHSKYLHLILSNQTKRGDVSGHTWVVISSEKAEPPTIKSEGTWTGTVIASWWTPGNWTAAANEALAKVKAMGRNLTNYCNDASCAICKGGAPCH